jgi:hypothetical protein
MHISVIGLFSSYEQAETAVLDLEQAGIVGAGVEVISDPERDARAATLSSTVRETVGDRIGRIFGRPERHDSGLSDKPPAREVYDVPGEMPDYIGDQEFYATHVRQEGAIVVVNVTSPFLATVAESVLSRHGSTTRDGRKGVQARQVEDQPRVVRKASTGQ